MLERSSAMQAQEGRGTRFSDDLPTAEVVRLLGRVRAMPDLVSSADVQRDDEFGTRKK
jgi:hypothetical protein